jgi:L,D-peptidoglycan transpeptidase YkuD (ErfK/YbiS/YcfS/YnhG family)
MGGSRGPRSERQTRRRAISAAVTTALLATTLTASAVGAGEAGTGVGVGASERRPATLTLPGRIGAAPDVLQMVTITSPSWGSTTGTLKAWERPPGGRWTVRHGPLQVVLGYAGWVVAARRVQSTGTSPAGRFTLPFAFGLRTNPGTRLVYHHVDGNDWWPYEPHDPATYNIYEFHKDPHSHWRPDFAEHLSHYPGQYDAAIVVGFNLPHGVHYSARRHQRVARRPADTGLGGGIFLHVKRTAATEGCVAMRSTHVQWLLRWLDPAKHPEDVMGPYQYVLHL